MKKIFGYTAAASLLFTIPLFVACGDDNSASATNSSDSYDSGEGYTIAMPFKYDEATGIAYQGTSSCYYHADSKTFTWEEGKSALDSNKLTIVGDSMWIGPVKRFASDNPDEQMSYDAYENRETLALSNSHDGIYGVWNVTGCERKLGETNIKCTKYIGNMSGIARTLNITKDTVYNTTFVNLDNLVQNEIKPANIIRSNLGFDIAEATLSYMLIENIIKKDPMQQLKQSFSIGNQKFEEEFSFKFDKTGMSYITTLSSNGSTCTKTERLGYITEKQCKEENAEFLLSARDKSEEKFYYEDGPVEGFGIDNREEFNECAKKLPTEETRELLSQYTTNYN